MIIDAECTLTYDGNNFLLRTVGSESGYGEDKAVRFSVGLETWLIEKIKLRDPKLLDDPKWRYRNLWHELMRILKVRFN